MRNFLSVVVVVFVVVSVGCKGDAEDEAAPSAGDASADTVAPVPDDGPATPDEGKSNPDPPAKGDLAQYCADEIGEPRVVEVAAGLWVAMGYDLANTILLHTPDGNVVIDVSMSPPKAQAVKDALMEVAPGPTKVIIYTHSHADHIGGASVWVEEGTEIWATDAFLPHLFKQYGAFRGAEVRRAQLQHGSTLTKEQLPCSAVGNRLDLEAALKTGVRAPTHTFTGKAEISVGGVPIELVEAHGETHDQLFVWIPSLEALMPGDNYYAAFPNLYTIRGTTPRPVGKWIASLDKMRRRDPVLLVPSHTNPIEGRDKVRTVLTNYRDGIQWVHDEVVRGANKLEPMDAMAARIKLPAHLAELSYLQELYGQVDWSAKAIYTNQLGWFDGQANSLYPANDAQSREIEMMGGVDAVKQAAIQARKDGELRWSAHLLAKLRDSGLVEVDSLAGELAATYEALGQTLQNSNGRGYLLQKAENLKNGAPDLSATSLDDEFVDAVPLATFFNQLPGRLLATQALDVYETAVFEFTDVEDRFVITVRHGVAELVTGNALPGTPDPVTVVTTDSKTWRRVVLQMKDQIEAVLDGTLAATDLLALKIFMDRFDQTL